MIARSMRDRAPHEKCRGIKVFSLVVHNIDVTVEKARLVELVNSAKMPLSGMDSPGHEERR
jgi:hypothetical protein